MIVKLTANITLDLSDNNNFPVTESQWEKFNIQLESIIEKSLEENEKIIIKTAEVVMEEIR